MVGADLTSALQEYADVVVVTLRQPRATLPAVMKPLAAPPRLVTAGRAARALRRLRPDIVHVHWVPNGLVPVLARQPSLPPAAVSAVASVVLAGAGYVALTRLPNREPAPG